MSDLKWLIGVLILLFVAWIVFGSRTSVGGPFIRSPGSPGAGETYSGSLTQGGAGTIEEEIENVKTDIRDLGKEVGKIRGSADSQYKEQVKILSHTGARQSLASKERVELRVDKNVKGKIPLTGWRLESGVSGVGDTIKKGTYLPYSGQVNTEIDIFVEAGDRVIVSTGRSPLGTSFRINQCTGYFEQFQNFEPALPRSCPKPIDDLPNLGVGTEAEKCIDFVEKLPRCELYLEEIPLGLSGPCLEYVTSKVNYNNCVINHKDDLGFYKNEWRVYLGRNEELWKNKREIIKLIDQTGKVVDVITY